jgi:hypothetical protein
MGKFLPFTVAGLATGAAVILGLWLTKDVRCLWGLLILGPISISAQMTATGKSIDD